MRVLTPASAVWLSSSRVSDGLLFMMSLKYPMRNESGPQEKLVTQAPKSCGCFLTKVAALSSSCPTAQHISSLQLSSSKGRLSQGITSVPREANFVGMPMFASGAKVLYDRPKSTTAIRSGFCSSSSSALRPLALRRLDDVELGIDGDTIGGEALGACSFRAALRSRQRPRVGRQSRQQSPILAPGAECRPAFV